MGLITVNDDNQPEILEVLEGVDTISQESLLEALQKVISIKADEDAARIAREEEEKQ